MQMHTSLGGFPRATLFGVAFLLPAFVVSGHAVVSAPTLEENFDIREIASPNAQPVDFEKLRARPLAPKRMAANAVTRGKMQLARDGFAARMPGGKVVANRFGTAPEIVERLGVGNFLTKDSIATRELTARKFMRENADLFGLSAKAITALVKESEYANPAGNLAFVEFSQTLNGLPVFQGKLRAAFTAKGALARVTGNLAPGLDAADLPAKPALTPAQAAVFAAAAIRQNVRAEDLEVRGVARNGRLTRLAPGPFADEISTELLCFPLEPGVATLAYAVVLVGAGDSFYVIVDATDGILLFRKDVTSHQSEMATYGFYDADSPSPFSPSTALPGTNTQPPGIARTTLSLISELPAFDNLGWMTDGLNETSGNNAVARQNSTAIGSPNRVFDFTYNPPPLGTDDIFGASIGPDPYRDGAITNAFVWMNRYHDRLYPFGFTESSQNFQADNFGRGGVAGDAVQAVAQFNVITNNADYSTYPDGRASTLRLGIFNGPTPKRDSSLDAEIIVHEMTHGLSSRLHGDATGLLSVQATGMGEGWSDFVARVLLSSADEDIDGIYAFGGYVAFVRVPGFTDNYYYGVRRFPYALLASVGANGKPHNPLTFADIDPQQIDLSDGAFPEQPGGDDPSRGRDSQCRRSVVHDAARNACPVYPQTRICGWKSTCAAGGHRWHAARPGGPEHDPGTRFDYCRRSCGLRR